MSDDTRRLDEIITLLIPTHNRHDYLDRTLDYYSAAAFPVIIADSTHKVYDMKADRPAKLDYVHLPGETLNAKLELAMNRVNTPYTVMCADDDFLIFSALESCVKFLQENSDYASAQGNCIAYMKRPDYTGGMELRVMYKHLLSYEIAADDPLSRIRSVFFNYRTLFYAVHRTQTLKLAFTGTAAVIKNLYLNEYITAIIPLAAGKYRELNVFYQVREFAEDSDDKTTINLDAIALQDSYATEFESYIQLMAWKLSAVLPSGVQITSGQLVHILADFARTINMKRAPTVKKKIGKLIEHIPFVGERLLDLSRSIETRNELKKVIRTEADERALHHVQSIIRKHSPR
jgi:glycosyltransferase domain-containing protein